MLLRIVDVPHPADVRLALADQGGEIPAHPVGWLAGARYHQNLPLLGFGREIGDQLLEDRERRPVDRFEGDARPAQLRLHQKRLGIAGAARERERERSDRREEWRAKARPPPRPPPPP